MAPVRFAIARCARCGSRPASHAITASTANSGSVCSQARIARARPWEMRNCAASAPQVTRKADPSMLGKVHNAESADPPAPDKKASTFSFTCAEDSPAPEAQQAIMGRDKMKSASRHGFHEGHTEPAPPVSAPTPPTPPTAATPPTVVPQLDGPTAFESLVREMLVQLGEDPTREGLRQTPDRVEASLRWLTRGYQMSVADVIGDALYHERHENLVCVRDIEIYSLCEHHMLPFFGRAHVAYLPNGRLVGLSKIPRVIEVFARRLQVQERLTDQVADALMDVLEPRGVGVVIEAYHLCMMMRGVEKQNSKTVTSALRGALLQDAKTRDEFLRLVYSGRGSE